jgi:cysteinyl-tRNA synthetase
VHETPHLGNFRRYVVSDIIRRYLEYEGFRVRHLLNIIDLDDRSIRGAEQANVDLSAFTRKGTVSFLEGLAKLNIRKDQEYPRASTYVDQMLKLAERLVDKGYAYEKLRSVYFDISKLNDYGRLSNVDVRRGGSRRTVEQDDYEKDSPADFALLKRSNLSELKRGIFFKTRWGNVRPSWHLECAAMSMGHLGETFDIHTGGADVVFPHCENVLAIGRGATGKAPANYWVNAELVMRDGKKMSRSLDNVISLEDLEQQGYTGREIRFFLLGAHYRKPLNFSLGAMDTAKNTLRKFDGFVQRLLRTPPGGEYGDTEQLIYDAQQGFTGAMNDDFNISGALAALFAFVHGVGLPLSRGLLMVRERERIITTLKGFDAVFGIMDFAAERLSDEALRLLAERDSFRKEGRWQEADRARTALAALGVEISDTPAGTLWRLQ